LTVTGVRANSSAAVLVNPATPCLAALYALLKGEATRACMVPVLMTRPQPRATMPGSWVGGVWGVCGGGA